MIRSAILMIITSFAIACQPAQGGIMGFGDGSGYTLNSISGPPPSINNGTLTLTSFGATNQAVSAFYDTRQSTGSFNAAFTYQASGPADGITFVMQNDPAGLAALGGAGSGLGYAAAPGFPSQIVNSVGLEINLYSFTHQGTNLATQGASEIFNYLPIVPVDFYTGHAIRFTIAYDASAHTLSETLVDTASPATTYSHVFTGINFATEVGSSSAYVGFTGGTGALTSTQTISDFQFQSTVPEPASLTLALMGIGMTFGLWRTRRNTAASGGPTACPPARS